MIELSLNEVMKYFGANLILSNITFEIHQGERVGLVGRNGSGKSTVLKLISGLEPIDKGDMAIRKGTKIGYLEQIPNYKDGYTTRKVLNLAFKDLMEIEENMINLEKKMRNLENEELDKILKLYSNMQQRYEIMGGYEKEEKLSKICNGLKFTNEFLNKQFSLLSGGEKTTVMLGKILLENPNILLLDEPTNHLDMDSLDWLESYLKEYKGTVLIVSHDRYFLDSVVSKIVEIEDLESKTYMGNYSDFLRQKEENIKLELEAYKEQQKKVGAMENSIKTLRDWANRSGNEKFFRRAASMQKRLDKIEKVDKPNTQKQNMKLNLINSERSGGEAVKIEGACKSFDDKILFHNANLLVAYGERVALIGANGSGKSTIMKVLLREEGVSKGKVELGANVKAAYLPQNIIFKDEAQTVIQYFRDDIDILEGKAREYLSKFMFFGESVFKKVKSLSGGEKTRLKLSKLLYEDINLLILDEPTNHLDIDSIEILEDALIDFKGTIFFISHDRYFINKICNRIVALENKQLSSYMGNYDYYKIKRSELKERQEEIKEKKPKKIREINEVKKKEIETKKIEKKINKLEQEISEVDIKINSLCSDYIELSKYASQKVILEKELEGLMEEWIKYNED
ncbi:ribosomal protection-like ABC-F family protein [Clostridium peptidivorans]|uniref:ribosomal protection-like ABC-F family protein n=1 Tax=Clostridium peptidivorans TaxID=100174 RepID=UPI000BE48FE8|nr:ABC-F family ATP-binding cassette domain-containing protein [Clostridium peptidivorans]